MDRTLLIVNTVLLGIILFTILTGKTIRRKFKKLFVRTAHDYRQLNSEDKDMLISRLEDAVRNLHKERIGALITLEKNESLEDYVASGHPIDGYVTGSLLRAIFSKYSPLHDGSVIIKGNRLVCSSAYFPTSTKVIDMELGSRHRAAVGITEVKDCVVIIVSETNGQISISKKGEIYKTDLASFAATLKSLW